MPRRLCRAVNDAARERMRGAGDLGDDVRLTTQRGALSFARGDRVMFLQNERGLGAKNSTLGTVEQVSERSMSVCTDDGRSVAFNLKDYDRLDHGYAATIHKAQGLTVDRSHVLATPGLDAHSSYVALSRHRGSLDLHYGRDDFADRDRLVRTLSRDRAKDMASDYTRLDPAQNSPSATASTSAEAGGSADNAASGRSRRGPGNKLAENPFAEKGLSATGIRRGGPISPKPHNPADFPPSLRLVATAPKCLFRNNKCLLCLVPGAVSNNQPEAAPPCPHQTVSSV